jgi:hypothetical protein
MSNREERIRMYRNPSDPKWWDGRSCYQENIDRWSARAHKESDGAAHRAKSGNVNLPPLGSRDGIVNHDTAAPPSGMEARERAKRDMNHDIGATMYMKGVRRNA